MNCSQLGDQAHHQMVIDGSIQTVVKHSPTDSNCDYISPHKIQNKTKKIDTYRNVNIQIKTKFDRFLILSTPVKNANVLVFFTPELNEMI